MREVTVSARAKARGQGQELTMRVKTVAFFFKTGYPGGMFKKYLAITLQFFFKTGYPLGKSKLIFFNFHARVA